MSDFGLEYYHVYVCDPFFQIFHLGRICEAKWRPSAMGETHHKPLLALLWAGKRLCRDISCKAFDSVHVLN